MDIKEILLSPFNSRESANKLAEIINDSYGIINIKQSNIK